MGNKLRSISEDSIAEAANDVDTTATLASQTQTGSGAIVGKAALKQRKIHENIHNTSFAEILSSKTLSAEFAASVSDINSFEEAPDIRGWSTEEVCEWLASNDFSDEIVKLFKQEQIDGKTLLLLKRADLDELKSDLELCAFKVPVPVATTTTTDISNSGVSFYPPLSSSTTSTGSSPTFTPILAPMASNNFGIGLEYRQKVKTMPPIHQLEVLYSLIQFIRRHQAFADAIDEVKL